MRVAQSWTYIIIGPWAQYCPNSCVSDSSLAYLSDLLGCTPLPGNFILLQTHRYFISSMLKQKPLAHALSLTVLQSNEIISLLTSVTFSPPMPSKLP